MMSSPRLLILFNLFVALHAYDKILMRDIDVLTLMSGRLTTGRRTAPVPQLNCVGVLCDVELPKVVQCYNKGSNDRDTIQWKCEGDLPLNYFFKNMEVSCEGYESPDDPFVLAGSCGLEYTLGVTKQKRQHTTSTPPDSSESTLFLVVFISALLIFACIVFNTEPRRRYYDDDYCPRYPYSSRTYYHYHYDDEPRRHRYRQSTDEGGRTETKTGYASTRNR